ncbi:MAG: hypothetical protein PHH73_01195 [Candidatus Rickettsiella isopodorum]|jgi:hypothetical protein|nr:hypothetical protein [Candidatus Rickettsiella isopodorum]
MDTPQKKIFERRLLGIILAVLSLTLALKSHQKFVFIFLLLLSFLLFAAVLLKPQLLIPIQNFFIKFGTLTGKITQPIIMVILFFLLFTPVSFFLKSTKKDPLNLKFLPHVENHTYWDDKEKFSTENMLYQF